MVKNSKASKTTTKKHQIKFKLKPRNEKSRSSSELPLMPVLLSKKQKKETIKLTTTHHVDVKEGGEFWNDLFMSRSPSTSSCSGSKRKPSPSSFSTNDCNSLFLVSPPSLSRSDCTTMTMAEENNDFLSSMENSAKKSFLRRRKRNCLYPHSRKNLRMRCRLPFQRKKQVTPLTNTAVDNKDILLDSASCPTTPPPLHGSTIFGFGRSREYPYEEDSLSHKPSFICNSSTSSSSSDRTLFSPMPTSLSSLAAAAAPRKEITTSVMCSSIGSLSLNNNNNNTQDGTSSKNNNKNESHNETVFRLKNNQ